MSRSYVMTLFAACIIAPMLCCSCTKPSDEQPAKQEEQQKEDPVPEDPTPEDPTPDDPAPDPLPETVRILAVGNSFSADAVEQELYPIFEAAGQKVIIGDLYIGGCPLSLHASNAESDAASYSYRKIVGGTMTTTSGVRLSEGLKDEPWDFVSIQEGAGFHGFYNTTYNGTTHSMEPALTNLIKYVQSKVTNKSCRIIYHVPWAAKTGYTGVKFSYYGYDQKVMYDMICTATKQVSAAHSEIDMVINTMDAIQNARSSFIGDNMNRDGWHLNYSTGRYTAGCIWAEKILGVSIVGNSYHPSTITDYVAKVCQTAAHEAVEHPYTVTDLSYFEAPAEEPQVKKEVLAQWYFTPERALADGGLMSWTGQTVPGVYRYSNEPGERGYYAANGAGQGKLSYVQIDKTKWSGNCAGLSVLDASNGGQPVMCGPMPGDFWQFETTAGREFEEGTQLNIRYTYTPAKYGARYWILEYLDGEDWKPALETSAKTLSLSGETITYNLELAASEFRIVDVTVTLANPTKEFKFRQRCCSEYQVNDKWFDSPNVKCVQRVAGDPNNELKPLPTMSKIL